MPAPILIKCTVVAMGTFWCVLAAVQKTAQNMYFISLAKKDSLGFINSKDFYGSGFSLTRHTANRRQREGTSDDGKFHIGFTI